MTKADETGKDTQTVWKDPATAPKDGTWICMAGPEWKPAHAGVRRTQTVCWTKSVFYGSKGLETHWSWTDPFGRRDLAEGPWVDLP